MTYRALKRAFALDDAFLDDLRTEFIFAKRLARAEHRVVLAWTEATPEVSSNTLDEAQSSTPSVPQEAKALLDELA